MTCGSYELYLMVIIIQTQYRTQQFLTYKPLFLPSYEKETLQHSMSDSTSHFSLPGLGIVVPYADFQLELIGNGSVVH